MVLTVKVLPGVPVRRRVATPHMSAGHAKTQVDPRRSHFEAVLAPGQGVGENIVDRVEMRACGHKFPSSRF